MPFYNKYKNKFFSILGDSISTFEGISIPKEAAFYTMGKKLASNILSVKDTWWGRIIDEFGGQLLINNSISGSTVTKHPQYEYQSYGCSDERTSSLGYNGLVPDVIMVYLGTNDWGHGFEISKNPTIDGEEDLSIFCTAYSKMIEKIKINYPNAEIWCFTLSCSYCSASSSFRFPYYSGGRHISEYCDAIRNTAKNYGCKIIELYNSETPFDTIDGFHPNLNGMETIAKIVLTNIK